MKPQNLSTVFTPVHILGQTKPERTFILLACKIFPILLTHYLVRHRKSLNYKTSLIFIASLVVLLDIFPELIGMMY
jgi:hypothetical protein